MSKEPRYVAHCIQCQATNQLALFAHRVDGQMVGWLFACPNCWTAMESAQMEIVFTSGREGGRRILYPRLELIPSWEKHEPGRCKHCDTDMEWYGTDNGIVGWHPTLVAINTDTGDVCDPCRAKELRGEL